MFIDTFIKRPVFTSVCAIIILLVGAIRHTHATHRAIPGDCPPQVQVTAAYTAAEVVEETVTTVLEREING